MRFKCEYKADRLPIANGMMFVSLIKQSLKKVNKDYFNEVYVYEDKSNKKIKDLCFAVNFSDYEIKDNLVYINGRVTLSITTSDYQMGINLYNGLLNLKEFTYKEFKLHKIRVDLIREKFINDEEVTFKAISPICIKNSANKFLNIEDVDYEKELNYIADKLLLSVRGYGLKEALQFQPVSMKKRVVKEGIRGYKEETEEDTFYVNAFTGTFKLKGDIEDLNYIYKTGIGFRRSQGFGMIDFA